MKERVVFIPPHDYHAAQDEYNERWDAVTAHQTSTPLPSVGLSMFGLQSHAFIDAEEEAEVEFLFRFLLNKEQHRFSPETMKWRTGQVGVSNEEISGGMTATAIRAAVQELIVECTGDGVDVRREDVEGVDEETGDNDGLDGGIVDEQEEEDDAVQENDLDSLNE
ncbi:hypothetical protein B0A54_09105 [Friedmanniomyces endolithicus]|uniref:Uncharacterized protein n=1 Tax=Friedmanniomyces endolithicus TaxID=329885 RepID=A0A4U0UX09_9PEZI|nr:hypothetical protein LTS09_002757 [Friedmanniomyces endolithicus]TKA40644.1 hypothetical protein B0A54_09105 [Friedmanniomyces endolithicus]